MAYDISLWVSCITLAAVVCGRVGFAEAAAEAVANSAASPVAAAQTAAPGPCRVSEFRCQNGRCIAINRFCDNVNDCGDSTDEPRFCTPCNRTYYGDVGKTYEVDLHRPREDKLPYICHLTFTANGGDYGDIVQLTFDSFTIGRFTSFTTDGCPDGHVQIAEWNRPRVGGSWCGTSWGPAIYYSETRAATLSVTLLRLNKDQAGYNFDFRMEYKMLRKDAATIRYGGAYKGVLPPNTTDSPEVPTTPPPPDYYLGELITGTYCSRIFSDCDRKVCRLQSPNFPGVYPRNLTCYYAVRQHEIPAGKHALITVRQPKGQLISIRSQSALYGTAKARELKVWQDCDDVQDYVTVYDGYTTRDPVILKFCGGGEAVPEAVSSGHELLVEFTTSPYGTFLHPSPVQSLHGFQLEVEVKFVDKDSPTYMKNKRTCEFWIRGTDRGVLENPQHSLTTNTTCLYHLQGIDTAVSPSPVPFRPLPPRYQEGLWRRPGFPFPRYRVWLSVLKFHVTTALGGPAHPEKLDLCSSNLNVWDGQLKKPSNCNDFFCNRDKTKGVSRTSLSSSMGMSGRNVTLLGRYCQNYIPRSCDHSFLTNDTRLPRPCSLAESYLSTADTITLELKLAESTALKPVTFKALYEFVDLHQDGDPYGSGPCTRRFVSTAQDAAQAQQHRFQAPRNVFLYGRGGAVNLSCIYRFEAQKDERIKVTITHVTIKNRDCQTHLSPDTDRLQCHGDATAALRLYEVPWADVPPVPRECVCGTGGTFLPFTYVSTSQVVELHFDALAMSAADDFESLYFEGTLKFVKMPSCSKNMRRMGASGELVFKSPNKAPDQSNCENYPLVITPSANRYLYVRMNGVVVRTDILNTTTKAWDCLTTNRIVLHAGPRSVVVCPTLRTVHVEVFSDGWKNPSLAGTTTDLLGYEPSRSIVVDFIGKEQGEHSMMWLELARRRLVLSVLGQVRPEECLFRCPELNACINASVWCDGIAHCPTGYDESLTHCSFLLQLPALYQAAGLLLLAAVTGSLCLLAYRRCRRRPRSVLQTRLKSLSSDTAIIDEKGVIC